MKLHEGALSYPLQIDELDCVRCGATINLRPTRERIEAESGMKAGKLK